MALHCHRRLTRGFDASHQRSTLVVALALVAVSCGSRDPAITPATIGADTLLYERAVAALEEENWTRAREYFIQIRDNYPQSTRRGDAHLGVAEAHEGRGTPEAYIAALSELRDFLSLYPTHERAPYAQYKLGVIYFRQMRSPERDQSETRDAIREFEIFIERYTDATDPELLSEARVKLREAKDRISDSSFAVGRFYYRSEYYPGAIDRFRSILDEDPGYTRRDAVYYHLADSLMETGKEAEALPLFERLVEEFPETERLEQTMELISKLRASMNLQDRR